MAQSAGMGDRLAILLTPPGAAAIAVVRLVADDVVSLLTGSFSQPLRPGRCVHGQLADGDEVLDDPVIVLHENGRTADLSLHGGPWVVRSVLQYFAGLGFEIIDQPAIPLPEAAIDGEDAINRAVQVHLPLARTELALRILLNQPAAWQPLLAGQLDRAMLQRMLDDRSLINLLRLPRVAIVGAPNAGKSTLANRLFAQERSITADLPGTTRDWIGETANIDGLAVTLVDTPGQRQTNDPIEAAAIAAATDQITQADLILLILDPTQPRDPLQQSLIDRYPDAIRIANKSDRPQTWLPPADALPIAATTEQGAARVRLAVQSHFDCVGLDPLLPRIWTDDQREWVHRQLSAR